ncbi:hypothetical protein Sros01_02590 [Streptomyces roseochromogenus]|nr:hypothetical protein Sros01_02590 [Streptomyces roseochromogenus]
MSESGRRSRCATHGSGSKASARHSRVSTADRAPSREVSYAAESEGRTPASAVRTASSAPPAAALAGAPAAAGAAVVRSGSGTCVLRSRAPVLSYRFAG